MTVRKSPGLLLTACLLLPLVAAGSAAAQQSRIPPVRALFEPFSRKTIAGEVMSVDREQRSVVLRVIENGDRGRDITLALDERAVFKKLRTPISSGDLTPGHLVKVSYGEHAGRLVAHRIEVTGKAVHQPMR